MNNWTSAIIVPKRDAAEKKRKMQKTCEIIVRFHMVAKLYATNKNMKIRKASCTFQTYAKHEFCQRVCAWMYDSNFIFYNVSAVP